MSDIIRDETWAGSVYDFIVNNATRIVTDLRSQGYSVTIRQLYYQFVSEGLVTNGQKTYKTLVRHLTRARMCGDFHISLLEDRGRTVGLGDYTLHDVDVDHALELGQAQIRSFPRWNINTARWWGQDTHVSVWVEKDALAGVFSRPCADKGVGLFACRGYPSLPSLWSWMQSTSRALDAGSADKAVILYFGDHDPEGWDIPRSAFKNIRALQRTYGLHFPIELVRCGLNMNQVRQHNPPPMWAKLTSARYKGYIEEHGTDEAWELDALPPSVLDGLIRDHVDNHFDALVHEGNLEVVEERRAEMTSRMEDLGWFNTDWD